MSTTNTYMTIAIDGPCAAGKTTQAKLLAKTLGYMYMDTGALYRTVALYMINHNKTVDDIDEVLNCIDMDVAQAYDGSQLMYLSGEDVTGDIRTSEVSKLASDISAYPAVREFLLHMQQDIIEHNDVVMEGRDIGTVIAPHADVKIFLTANFIERAKRRYTELKNKGSDEDFLSVTVDLLQRDTNDMSRKVAPLKQADDAVYLDCSDMDINAVHRAILDIKDNIVYRKGYGKVTDMLSNIKYDYYALDAIAKNNPDMQDAALTAQKHISTLVCQAQILLECEQDSWTEVLSILTNRTALPEKLCDIVNHMQEQDDYYDTHFYKECGYGEFWNEVPNPDFIEEFLCEYINYLAKRNLNILSSMENDIPEGACAIARYDIGDALIILHNEQAAKALLSKTYCEPCSLLVYHDGAWQNI